MTEAIEYDEDKHKRRWCAYEAQGNQTQALNKAYSLFARDREGMFIYDIQFWRERPGEWVIEFNYSKEWYQDPNEMRLYC